MGRVECYHFTPSRFLGEARKINGVLTPCAVERQHLHEMVSAMEPWPTSEGTTPSFRQRQGLIGREQNINRYSTGVLRPKRDARITACVINLLRFPESETHGDKGTSLIGRKAIRTHHTSHPSAIIGTVHPTRRHQEPRRGRPRRSAVVHEQCALAIGGFRAIQVAEPIAVPTCDRGDLAVPILHIVDHLRVRRKGDCLEAEQKPHYCRNSGKTIHSPLQSDTFQAIATELHAEPHACRKLKFRSIQNPLGRYTKTFSINFF
jgi:hypothetical protein